MSLNDITEPDPTPVGNEEQAEAPKLATEKVTEPASPMTVTTPTQNLESGDSSEPIQQVPVNSPTTSSDALLDAILNNIVPVGNSRPPIKLMLYSFPGAGKTSIAGQIEDNLIIDTEHGRLTIEENKVHLPELVKDSVRFFPYTSFEGIERTTQKFLEAPEALSSIKTITIDTLNNLHKRGLAAVTERAWEISPSQNNRYVAETEHHTENNERVRQLVQNLIDTQRNIVIMAHARTIEPKNQTPRTFPDFSEKLANTISAMVDVVGYIYMTEIDGENKRVIRFRPTNSISAKSRIHGLPDNMIDPTWAKIMEQWK